MKKFTVLLTFVLVGFYQNIKAISIEDFKHSIYNGSAYLQIETKKLLSVSDLNIMSQSGFKHIKYITEKYYTASFEGDFGQLLMLEKQLDFSTYKVNSSFKFNPSILSKFIEQDIINCTIKYQNGISISEVKTKWQTQGIIFNDVRKVGENYLHASLSKPQFELMINAPEICFVDVLYEEDVALNYSNRLSSGNAYLSNPIQLGGRNLLGQGIIVGHGDNSDPNSHIDLSDRVIDFNGSKPNNHGIHTMGTLAGAGNIQPRWRGILTHSQVISQYFSNIITNTPQYVQNYHMSLTSNSYAATIHDCSQFGVYDLISQNIDQLSLDYSQTLHIFAAGNDGGFPCVGYPKGYSTVEGQYQSGKNVIVVGNINAQDKVYNSSSKGPLKNDKRLKPDIVAVGTAVTSSIANNGYSADWGTSMATPVVSGIAGQLIQRYSQLNNGAYPQSDIIKAALLNGAYDLGRKGPDIEFGYGRVSSLRSVQIIENKSYFEDTLTLGDSTVYLLNISPNKIYKFLLYYHDQAATPFIYPSLVNDLDFYILNPNGNKILPLSVDATDTTTMMLPAKPLIDTLNNTEQIVLEYAPTGNYKLIVKGKKIVNGSQRFVLAIDSITPGLFLRSPYGGEKWISTSDEYIAWDYYDTVKHTTSVFYSIDNGVNWTLLHTISNPLLFDYFVPNITTDSNGIKFKLVATNGWTAESGVVDCNPLMTLNLAPNNEQCPGYAKVTWTAIAGAKQYKLYQKIGKYMVLVDSTTNTNYTFKNLSLNQKQYFAIRAQKGNLLSEQSFAISHIPNTGSCQNVLYNNDLTLRSTNTEITGRQFTSTDLTNITSQSFQIKNNGLTNVDSARVYYTIDNGNVQVVDFTNIAGGSSIPFNISNLNLTIAKKYQLKLYIKNLSSVDPNSTNDTLYCSINHLPNSVLDLNIPWLETFESSSDTINFSKIGVSDLSRWDFSSNKSTGRMRTFLIKDFAYSGNKAATLDVSTFTNPFNTNSLISTLNLSNDNVDSSRIRLDFWYKHHGQNDYFGNDNSIYIRGNDSATWLPLFDLMANKEPNPGIYKSIQNLELDKILRIAGQQFSTSTQVKFTQSGMYKTGDDFNMNGFTFDDIKFYKVKNDIQLSHLLYPTINSCGLSSSESLTFSIRNSNLYPIYNCTIAYRIDGQAWQTETIAILPKDSTIQFTFNTTCNLSALGNHKLDAYIHYVHDNYSTNDTLNNILIFNAPNIQVFPYVQKFEDSTHYWLTHGINNSWELGNPEYPEITNTPSGTHAWITNKIGNYSANQKSYLVSPCFDITSLSKPTLSFNMAYNIENCGSTYCDGAWLEISYDGGINWAKLDTSTVASQSIYSDQIFKVWNGNHEAWQGYTIALSKTIGSNIKLRFVFESDMGYELDGIAIDDIHIYEGAGFSILNNSNVQNQQTNTLVANQFNPFIHNDSIYCAIQPNSQQLGSMNTNIFINSNSNLTTFLNSYYLDRNWVIHPQNPNLNDSVTLRLYFLKSDIEKIIADTTCHLCFKPKDITSLNCKKFSSIYDSLENNLLYDNTIGINDGISNLSLDVIPYKNGYYVDVQVKTFSEFWLHFGENNTQQIQMNLINFQGYNHSEIAARVEWNMQNENNNHHFEIERATDNISFSKVGSVVSIGNGALNSYQFIDDNLPNKNQIYYYRIKWLNNGGETGYSQSVPVVFGNSEPWLIYPNPIVNSGFLQFQLPRDSKLNFEITDMLGRSVFTNTLTATGYLQKILFGESLASGVYKLHLYNSHRKETFKFIKL